MIKILHKLRVCQLLLIILILASCAQNPPIETDDFEAGYAGDVFSDNYPEEGEENMDNVDNESNVIDLSNLPQSLFGFANIDGSEIILLGHSREVLQSAIHFKYAIGENGAIYKIEYDRFQEWNRDAPHGRDTAENFANLRGTIYRVIDAPVIPGRTYLLITQEKFDEITIFEGECLGIHAFWAAPFDDPFTAPEVSDEAKAKYSEARNWEVTNGWMLTEYPNGYRINFIAFDFKGDDAIFWVVLESDDKFQYFEFATRSYSGDNAVWFFDEREWDFVSGSDFFIVATVENQEKIIVYFGRHHFMSGEVLLAVAFPKDDSVPPYLKMINHRMNIMI